MANPFHLISKDAFFLIKFFLFIPFLPVMQLKDRRKSVYLSREMKLNTDVVSDVYVVDFCTEITTLCRHLYTLGIMYCQDNCLKQYSLA